MSVQRQLRCSMPPRLWATHVVYVGRARTDHLRHRAPSPPRPTATWSHGAIKLSQGPLPVRGTKQGGSQLATTSRASRRLPPGFPTPAAYRIDPTEGPIIPRAIYQDCHDRPADFFAPPSPASSGGYSNGMTNSVNEFEISNLRELPALANRVWCQHIGPARI